MVTNNFKFSVWLVSEVVRLLINLGLKARHILGMPDLQVLFVQLQNPLTVGPKCLRNSTILNRYCHRITILLYNRRYLILWKKYSYSVKRYSYSTLKYCRVRVWKHYQYARFPLGIAGDQREVSIFEPNSWPFLRLITAYEPLPTIMVD